MTHLVIATVYLDTPKWENRVQYLQNKVISVPANLKLVIFPK